MRTFIFPLVVGVGGVAVLLWLAFWQLERREWKDGIIADINARLGAAPIPLQDSVLPEVDNYVSVIIEGAATGEEIRFLDSGTSAGTGHHIISAFVTTQGRRVMLDQGLMEINDADARAMDPLTDVVTVQGNLIWPDDISNQPPSGDEWYARDVVAMSEALGTEPILIQLSAASQYDPRVTPLPVDTHNIKSDHLEYAITWLLLAVVWLSMTLFYVARTRRQKDS